jgi:hypothetical protein
LRKILGGARALYLEGIGVRPVVGQPEGGFQSAPKPVPFFVLVALNLMNWDLRFVVRWGIGHQISRADGALNIFNAAWDMMPT